MKGSLEAAGALSHVKIEHEDQFLFGGFSSSVLPEVTYRRPASRETNNNGNQPIVEKAIGFQAANGAGVEAPSQSE